MKQHHRNSLEALDWLTTRSASTLAALIEPLDEQYRRRTQPDPRVAAGKPWWERRIRLGR